LQENKFISIGKITKTVGLKGYVKVLSLTDFPDRFKNLESIILFNEKENRFAKNKFSNSKNFYIKNVLYEKDYVKILFEGYEDIEISGNLVGYYLVLEEEKRMNLEKGSHYYYDLIGLEVINERKIIGHTVAVENYGGQDLFRIKLTDTKNEILIPYVKDFIKNIDFVKKIMEIEVIDGMLN
jgi:16S rRNA processing protein RimM